MKAICIGNNRLNEIGIFWSKYSIAKIYFFEIEKTLWKGIPFRGQRIYRMPQKTSGDFFFLQEIFDLNFRIVEMGE